MENPTLHPKQSGKRNFNLKVWFYDNHVDMDTGEVTQREFVYVGARIKRELALANIKVKNELDALLFKLHKIQLKCMRVVCFDNNYPKYSPESIVFKIEKGVVISNFYRLNQYECSVKNYIPDYKLVPHEQKEQQAA